MTALHTRRATCRLCDGSALQLALPMAASAIADEYVPEARKDEPQPTFPLDVYLCRTCGHTQLLDVVSPERLFANYAYVTSVSLGLVEHFRRQALELVEFAQPGSGSFVCEIGSNEGSLLRAFQERGFVVLGVDPARAIAERATVSGVETLPTFFTSALARKIRDERGAAALIVANNVFAHADGLGDIAEGVRTLLAPRGVFAFEVSYMVDIVDRMLFDTIYHEHLCYHSVKPLVTFLAHHGLEMIAADRIATKGGSLRVKVQHRGGPHAVAPSVGALLALERELAFDQPEPFRRFAARIEDAKQKLLACLDAPGIRATVLAGFGASATVTTLMYQFDLGARLSFLVDDNPAKHGTYSPGYHVPVLPSLALTERRPPRTLILAWNYAKPILSKQQAYLSAGGQFVVPLPELELVGVPAS